MEIQEKIALVAKRVNEITFIEERNKRDNILIHPYTEDFKASVSLKVGNLVKEVFLAKNSEYHSSVGRYGEPDYVQGYTAKWNGLYNRLDNPFQSLLDAGIDIDFSEIIKEYEIKLERAKIHTAEILVEKENIKIAKLKEEYKTSWPVIFQKTLQEDKNKKVVAIANKVTIKPVTEEEFVSCIRIVEIEYNGFSTTISKNPDSYVLNCDVYKDNNSEIKHVRVFDKPKKSTSVGGVVLKFIEAIDEYVVYKENEKNKNNKEYRERKTKIKILSEVSELPVTTFVETKYADQGKDTYKVYNFMIVTKVPSDKYSKYEGININTEVVRQYINEQYIEIPNSRTYSISNLIKLSEQQFKGILKILLEEKQTFSPSKNNENIYSEKIEN